MCRYTSAEKKKKNVTAGSRSNGTGSNGLGICHLRAATSLRWRTSQNAPVQSYSRLYESFEESYESMYVQIQFNSLFLETGGIKRHEFYMIVLGFMISYFYNHVFLNKLHC